MFTLGSDHNFPLALTRSELGLPEASTFVTQTQVRALPEIMGFVTACLGVVLAVYLIKSWKK